MKLINHGQWERYTPDAGIIGVHWKNTVTGVDFYEFMRATFNENSITACTNSEGKIYEVSRGELPAIPDMEGSYLWEVIPGEEDEQDYMKYMNKWISIKKKVFKKDVEYVPSKVMASQAKIAMHGYRASLYNLFTEVVRDSEDVPFKIYFTDSSYWDRSSPYIVLLIEKLGISESIMDRIFQDAEKVV